jgi:uncharacterized membrane protein (UPF0127 family)
MPSNVTGKTVSAPSAHVSVVGCLWLVCLTLAIFIVAGLRGAQPQRTLQVNGTGYQLEVAHSEASRYKGLGGRGQLAAHSGMVFVYDAPVRQCFWMKDMRFAIDIVWVDSSKRVVQVANNVQPDSYPQTYCAPSPAAYVLEVPAGTASTQAIANGQQLSF